MVNLLLALSLVMGSAANGEAETASPADNLKIGDYITLGKYNGEPILWRYVADDENGKLIVSDKILCEKIFDTKTNKWEDSFIRAWLNSSISEDEANWNFEGILDFYVEEYKNEKGFLHESNFSESEKSVMKPVTQWTMLPEQDVALSENGINTAYNGVKSFVPGSPKDGGFTIYYDISELAEVYHGAAHKVTDKIFLMDEMQIYNIWKNFGTVESMWYNDDRNSRYYLRTPYNMGESNYEIGQNYDAYVTGYSGIRPAFYLEENNAVILSGDGTLEEPYVINGKEALNSDSDENTKDDEPSGQPHKEWAPLTITTNFGTTVIDNGLYIEDGKKYMPLVGVSEALGAIVYKNNEDNSIFIISRDSDRITHVPSKKVFVLNDFAFRNDYSSLPDEEQGAFVPVEMIETVYGVTICYDEKGAYIKGEFDTNYHHRIIARLFNYCLAEDFYPENFMRYLKYNSDRPSMDTGSVICRINIGLDKKYYDDASIINDPNTRTVLVNKLNRLPDNYTPQNLVIVEDMYVMFSDGGEYLMEPEAYNQYKEMYNAAAEEGVNLKIFSAYRTEENQRTLNNSSVNEYGLDYTERYCARPGYSEHQTGLAVDLSAAETSFENTKEYEWLKNNAYKYGFIERYPQGKEFITGYAYKPGHYRYVGIDAAEVIYQNEITYEEYYARYIYKSPFSIDKDRTWTNVIQKFYR